MTDDDARVIERAEAALKTNAEAYRLATEALEMRQRAEAAEVERDRWRALAAQHRTERDALRRTLADLLEMHPARIVSP